SPFHFDVVFFAVSSLSRNSWWLTRTYLASLSGASQDRRHPVPHISSRLPLLLRILAPPTPASPRARSTCDRSHGAAIKHPLTPSRARRMRCRKRICLPVGQTHVAPLRAQAPFLLASTNRARLPTDDHLRSTASSPTATALQRTCSVPSRTIAAASRPSSRARHASLLLFSCPIPIIAPPSTLSSASCCTAPPFLPAVLLSHAPLFLQPRAKALQLNLRLASDPCLCLCVHPISGRSSACPLLPHPSSPALLDPPAGHDVLRAAARPRRSPPSRATPPPPCAPLLLQPPAIRYASLPTRARSSIYGRSPRVSVSVLYVPRCGGCNSALPSSFNRMQMPSRPHALPPSRF
ncbi:hypothetical protein DFH09DRAFT_1474624, partial [Mycena vulgaris]